MSRRWHEIVLPIPTGLVDEAAALLDLAGFGGVEVRDAPGRNDVVVVVETDGEAGLAARVEDARRAVVVLGGPDRVETSELDPKVWTENWKEHFRRRTFGGRIEIRPPWEDAPAPGGDLVSVVVNPGMAFGTGLHETTAGCLELLADLVRPGMRVADVGCGSGILAIAAARLGAADVLATDVDPIAVDAAIENARANGVARIVQVEREPGEVGAPEWETNARPGLAAARQDERVNIVDKSPTARVGSPNASTESKAGGFHTRGAGAFDLVVANILAETLVEMRDSLVAALRSSGTLVLSGIETSRLKIVEDAFIRSPLRRGRTLPMGNWVTLALHHEALAEPDQNASRTTPPGGTAS